MTAARLRNPIQMARSVVVSLAHLGRPSIGGIAVAAFVLLMREVVAKNIFPMLTNRQGYVIILTVISLAWLLAVLGMLLRPWTSGPTCNKDACGGKKRPGHT